MRVHESKIFSPISLIIFVMTICLFSVSVHAGTITVTGNGDTVAIDGQCTLREAITAANTDAVVNECPGGAGADVIMFDTAGVFATPQTITLGGTELVISGAATIDGPGARLLTVSGSNLSRVFKMAFQSNVSLEGLTITGGAVLPFGGGGGGVSSSGTLTISDSVVTGNRAALGGGIYYEAYGPLTVVRSTISNNIANSDGGGIYAYGDVLVVNSTVSGNSSSGHGGGINDNGAGNTITILNSTITRNEAAHFGGLNLYVAGTSVGNSIIAGNTAAGLASDVSGPLSSSGHNIIGSGAPGFIAAAGDQIGTVLSPIDPMLGPLQYNGGSTKTHALLSGSPAIDAGTNPNTLAMDQRGYQRNHDFAAILNGTGDGTDVGAFELDPDTDGDGVRDFTDNCPGTSNPEKIAFVSDRDGNDEIYLMNPDGTGQTNLTNHPAPDGEPEFSRDGTKIVFRRGSEIYVMNANGSNPTRLTNNTTDDAEPAFSPDGTKIVFTSRRDGNYEIYLMDANGSNQTRLTDDEANDFSPTFSPDGSKIAFASNRSGNFRIYVMNTDGTDQIYLTNSLGQDGNPEFSPDGSKIAFGRGGGGEIYIMNADGTGETNLTNSATSDGQPTFSPDGSKIAFYGRLGGARAEIYVMNGDGSDQTRLTYVDAVDDWQPAWGPQADSDGDGIGDACDGAAPVANNDEYSIDEDPALPLTGNVLDNDTDDVPLTALKVTDPTNGTVIFGADGSFSYTPHLNFNGADSFAYKANDGSLDSNIATVTITIHPVNDAPHVNASPETQSVQYSDSISTVNVGASDIEPGPLAIAFSYSKDGGAAVAGLPAGMTQGGASGAWTVSGKANVPVGSYVITASVTDTGDGSSPPITSTDTFTIVVTRENAVAVPRLSNPVAMQVGSGGTATGTTGEFCFDFAEVADGSPGNISLIDSASLQINAVGGGSVSSITPSWITFSNVGPPFACVRLSLVGTAPNVFEITLNIGGDFYTGSGTTAFLVFDPSAGFASGGGWITNPNTGYRANYGVNVKYLKNGNAQGSILYIEHRPDGDYKFKSTSLNSSGGFAIVPISGGAEAQIAGKGNYGLNGVFTGNYSFITRLIDKGNPGTNDSFGLKVIAPNGQVMNEFTFNPQILGGGNNQVPKK